MKVKVPGVQTSRRAFIPAGRATLLAIRASDGSDGPRPPFKGKRKGENDDQAQRGMNVFKMQAAISPAKIRSSGNATVN